MMASRYHCGSLRSIIRGALDARRNEPPDGDGTVGGVEGDAMRLAVQGEAAAAEEVLGFDDGVVGQAELPQGDLVAALLPAVRIEVDEHHHALVPRRRHAEV